MIIFTCFVKHYYQIGSSFFFFFLHYSFYSIVASLNEKVETEFPLIINNCKYLLPTMLICVALKWFSVIQERNYPSVNRPKLCVLHTIIKLDFEIILISMSTSLPKNLFSISECSLFEFITCVVNMYVHEQCSLINVHFSFCHASHSAAFVYSSIPRFHILSKCHHITVTCRCVLPVDHSHGVTMIYDRWNHSQAPHTKPPHLLVLL